MEIEMLISTLRYNGNYAIEHDGNDDITAEDGRLMLKAAEVIELLWEVAKESYEAKYQMQFDKEAANNGG